MGREWLALSFGKWAGVYRAVRGCDSRVDRLGFFVYWVGVSFWVKRWFGPGAWVLGDRVIELLAEMGLKIASLDGLGTNEMIWVRAQSQKQIIKMDRKSE